MILAAILAALSLFAAPAKAQTPSPTEKVIEATDLKSGGLITRFPGDLLPPNFMQQSLNMLADKTGILTRRNGYAQYNQTACAGSQPIRGLWPFFATDGTQYIIAFSSGSMFSLTGNGTCTVIPGLNGGLSTTANMECVQTLGYLWCADGIDQLFRTRVTSTDFIASAPIGPHIGAFRNRVLVAGVSGTLTDVYGSGELDGTDWTIPAVSFSTSPFIINVSGTNDGLPVTCLMGEFQNQFLIGRSYDLYGLAGYDNRDFTLRKVSGQIGCLEPRSPQEVNNVFHWLSNRGIEALTGTQISRISYPIDPTIQLIIQSAGNTRTQTLTTQSDWQSGNLTASGAGAPLSATISVGNIVPSTFTGTDNTNANFSAGSAFFQISTSNFTGIYISSNNFQDDWSNNNVAGRLAWTTTAGSFNTTSLLGSTWLQTDTGASSNLNDLINTSSIAIPSGSWSFDWFFSYGGSASCGPGSPFHCFSFRFLEKDSSNFYQLEMIDDGIPSVRVALIKTVGGTPTTLTQKSTSVSQNTRYTFSIIRSTDGRMFDYMNGVFIGSTTADTSVTNPTKLEIAATNFTSPSVKNNFTNVYAYQYNSSGTFHSRLFDTSFSTPTWGPLSSTSTFLPGEGQVNFYTYVSTSPNNDLWDAPVAASDTVRITSAQKRYIKYRADLFTFISTKTPTVNAVSLEAATSGYYITPCITVSTPTSWGTFVVNGVTNGGTLTFYVSTGATCAIASAPNANWTLQGANTSIVVTTATNVIAARVLFTVDSGTQTPTLNDITFTWNNGVGRPQTASARWDDRYILFFTTNTASAAANDHAIILDQNQHWQLWDHINAASAAIYLNTLYTGDSIASGLIYQQDIGATDNGSAFTMTFQTADFDGGDPDMRKTFSRAYLLLGAPSSNNSSAALTCNYAVDGSSLTYSLGTVTLSEAPESTGYFVAKLPFPSSLAVTAHWINLLCSYTGSVGPVAIRRLRLVYSEAGWQ